jgi:hypothetical protein
MSLYDRILTEAKLSRAGVRILDWLAGMAHSEHGYVMVEYPKSWQFGWKPFGPSQKDLQPFCTLSGCGSRQVQALMKRGLIEPAGGGAHKITKKGRAALEATGWKPPPQPYTSVPRHLER